MRRALLNFAIFVVLAVIGHLTVLYAAPGVIMGAAMDRMEGLGLPLHAFAQSPRTTPETQTVVRPSPDLAYSICRFDFTQIDGPLEIQAGVWRDYSSISFFDSRTNNFATVPVLAGDEAEPTTRLVLYPPGRSNREEVQSRSDYLRAPSKRGLVLIRRLAPTAEAYAHVERLAERDRC
ncbi:MAG: DUF1254 domain-containing protein, partial [Pseudomonadota bacterium]